MTRAIAVGVGCLGVIVARSHVGEVDRRDDRELLAVLLAQLAQRLHEVHRLGILAGGGPLEDAPVLGADEHRHDAEVLAVAVHGLQPDGLELDAVLRSVGELVVEQAAAAARGESLDEVAVRRQDAERRVEVEGRQRERTLQARVRRAEHDEHLRGTGGERGDGRAVAGAAARRVDVRREHGMHGAVDGFHAGLCAPRRDLLAQGVRVVGVARTGECRRSARQAPVLLERRATCEGHVRTLEQHRVLERARQAVQLLLGEVGVHRLLPVVQEGLAIARSVEQGVHDHARPDAHRDLPVREPLGVAEHDQLLAVRRLRGNELDRGAETGSTLKAHGVQWGGGQPEQGGQEAD